MKKDLFNIGKLYAESVVGEGFQMTAGDNFTDIKFTPMEQSYIDEVIEDLANRMPDIDDGDIDEASSGTPGLDDLFSTDEQAAWRKKVAIERAIREHIGL